MGEVEGDLGVDPVLCQKRPEGLYPNGQAVFGDPVIIQVTAPEMALHLRGEGLPEVGLDQHDDRLGARKDVFGVGAGDQIEAHLANPSIRLLSLQQQLFLGVERFCRGESDIRKSQLQGLFYNIVPGEHSVLLYVFLGNAFNAFMYLASLKGLLAFSISFISLTKTKAINRIASS